MLNLTILMIITFKEIYKYVAIGSSQACINFEKNRQNLEYLYIILQKNNYINKNKKAGIKIKIDLCFFLFSCKEKRKKAPKPYTLCVHFVHFCTHKVHISTHLCTYVYFETL